jgi:hypothetical protein
VKDRSVHIHDDSKGLKFESRADVFKKDLKRSLETLKKGSTGVVKIEGSTDTPLYLIRDQKRSMAFLGASSSTALTELETFVKGC